MAYNTPENYRFRLPHFPANTIEAEISLFDDQGNPSSYPSGPTGGLYGEGGAVANVHHQSPSTPVQVVGVDADMYSIAKSTATPEVAALAKTKSSVLSQDQILDLKEEGFPSGLAEEMGKTRALYPVRFWVLDNSGSMMSNDGQSIRGSISVQCTRWAELQETVNYQSKMASILQATSHFRFLNDPGVRCGPQEFSIADRGANAVAEVEEVKALMQKCKPYGPTPLTHHLVEIGQRIAVMESRMRRKGLEAVVVLATDGLPTSLEGDTSPQINEEFVKALQYLQSLPVWVVVRLCTDERKVVNFYNELDNILELPLEVLDDFFNEAKEVHTHNKWLNYGLPLHRSREIGYHHRLFDLLDERPLNKDEIKEFCGILFGADQFAKAPDVHEDWKGFVNLVRTAVKAEELQFNPMTRKVGPWVDVKQLQKAFGGGISRLFCKSG